MVGIKPSILSDLAFQLSFLSMAGLVFLAPLFQKRLGMAVAATLGAVIITLPFIALNFQRISLVSVPATLLGLPALPGIIVTSALVGGVGLISTPLAQALGWVAWLFLSYLIKVVELFSTIPLAYIETGPVKASWLVIYYGALILVWWLARPPKSAKVKLTDLAQNLIKKPTYMAQRFPSRWFLAPLAIIATLIWLAVIFSPDNRLHVFFFDVGQGDATLIITPSHRKILVDGGPSPEAVALELGKTLPFWDRSIDLVVLTHPHEDHLAGLVEIIGRYKAGQILEGGTDRPNPLYERWLTLIKEKNITRTLAQAGQRIDLGPGTWLEVLHPRPLPREMGLLDLDDRSVVLRLAFGEVSFLLTGDINGSAEGILMASNAELESTVFKVAHHGSDASTSPLFLEEVNPKIVIISVGKDNRFGHPDKEIVDLLKEKGIEMHRTDCNGTIEALSNGTDLWVKDETECPASDGSDASQE